LLARVDHLKLDLTCLQGCVTPSATTAVGMRTLLSLITLHFFSFTNTESKVKLWRMENNPVEYDMSGPDVADYLLLRIVDLATSSGP
jgi:hypothetical protein